MGDICSVGKDYVRGEDVVGNWLTAYMTCARSSEYEREIY